MNRPDTSCESQCRWCCHWRPHAPRVRALPPGSGHNRSPLGITNVFRAISERSRSGAYHRSRIDLSNSWGLLGRRPPIYRRFTLGSPWTRLFTPQRGMYPGTGYSSARRRRQIRHRTRELALFNLAIDSKLRSCDLVKLRVPHMCHGNIVAVRAMVRVVAPASGNGDEQHPRAARVLGFCVSRQRSTITNLTRLDAGSRETHCSHRCSNPRLHPSR
jgi:hypothetical protein